MAKQVCFYQRAATIAGKSYSHSHAYAYCANQQGESEPEERAISNLM
jgi:hypothetical protein